MFCDFGRSAARGLMPVRELAAGVLQKEVNGALGFRA